MPKVNFNVPFKDAYGQPLMEAERDRNTMRVNHLGQIESKIVTNDEGIVVMKPVILRDVVVDILLDNYTGDDSLSGGEKLRRHNIAQRIIAAEGEADFAVDELAVITDLAAKKRPTLVLGRINDAINA